MSTIVGALQPTILATLAIGVPAFSIRETAVCRRSWNRQAIGALSSSGSVSSVSPFKIHVPPLQRANRAVPRPLSQSPA